MIKITAVPRPVAEKIEPPFKEGFFVISITEPGAPYVQLHSNWKDILRLSFHDTNTELPNVILISGSDGELINKFVMVNYRQIQHLVVHCSAGLSRSPGVLVALEEIYNGRDVSKEYPLYNKLVYRTVIRAFSQIPAEQVKAIFGFTPSI